MKPTDIIYEGKQNNKILSLSSSPIIQKYSEGVENMFIRIKVITIMKHLAMVY